LETGRSQVSLSLSLSLSLSMLGGAEAGGLPLEPLNQPFFFRWVFSRWGLVNYLPRLASNPNPPDLCLLSSWDYWHEPLAPGSTFIFIYLLFIFEVYATQVGHHLAIFLAQHQGKHQKFSNLPEDRTSSHAQKLGCLRVSREVTRREN
jgi:hypothetical protein